VNKAKAKGTAVESAAVLHLIANGFPDAERRSLAGSADRGDILVRRRPCIVAECKYANRGVQVTPWMREVNIETANAGASYGFLIAKQKGAGDRKVGRWVAAMHEAAFRHLVQTAHDRSVFPPLYEPGEVSPVHVNSHYVPMLAARGNMVGDRWKPIPFAVTYTPGQPEQRTVLGPLDQFIDLFKLAGLTEEESS
jgi:hypothetical protein